MSRGDEKTIDRRPGRRENTSLAVPLTGSLVVLAGEAPGETRTGQTARRRKA